MLELVLITLAATATAEPSTVRVAIIRPAELATTVLEIDCRDAGGATLASVTADEGATAVALPRGVELGCSA